MKKAQKLENARRLCREIVRVENKIQSIIDSNQYIFDVTLDQNNGWIVVTSYCQMGGCIAGFLSAKSEISAKRIAAEMTLHGKKPNYEGLCNSCREDLIQMQI